MRTTQTMQRVLGATMLLATAACGAGGPTDAGARGDAAGTAVGTGATGTTPGDDRCLQLRGRTFENFTVPVGTTCTLQDVRVRGNVVALERSRLFLVDAVVGGNVDGIAARTVQVERGRIEGSIQIKDAASPGELGASVRGTVLTQGNIQVEKMRTGRIVIADAVLEKGNIKIEENAVDQSLDATGNRVAQNLQAFKNVGAGAKSITGNRVGQTLECKENAAPFNGGPNEAGEAKEQCTR